MTADSTLTPDLTLQAFTEPRADRASRIAAGAAARIETPLEAHAHLVLPPDRDALALLHAQESSREPGLIPIRYERMGASPFAFLRGSAAVMAADLSAGARTTIRAQLCGDAHVANFGMFASPDRRLVFDLNDFDETLPGPVRVGRQAAGRQRGRRRAARRGQAQEDPGCHPRDGLLLPHDDRSAGPEEPDGGLVRTR